MINRDMAVEEDVWGNETPLGLAGLAYDRLVDLILSGELRPLQRLRIHALADSWGMSATPIREALVRASAIGFVTRENNKGFRVAPRPGAVELDDLFEARLAIESKTAWLAAAHAGPDLISSLESTFERQGRAGEEGSFQYFRDFLDGDRDFHSHIANAARNRFLSAGLEVLGSHVQRYLSFDRTVVTDRAETLTEHRAIITAIASGNPLAAQSSMTLHLANLRQRVHRERTEDRVLRVAT